MEIPTLDPRDYIYYQENSVGHNYAEGQVKANHPMEIPTLDPRDYIYYLENSGGHDYAEGHVKANYPSNSNARS
jgi:hypothetical protein